VSPGDRAATHAYLAAYYAYEQAVAATVPASIAAERAAATSIGGECAGALTSAPKVGGFFQAPPSEAFSVNPRQRGERARQSRQLADLTDELDYAISRSGEPLLAQASAAFAATAQSLSWSKPSITEGVRGYLAESEVGVTTIPTQPCADIRAWASSGYTTLAAATRAFLAALEAQIAPLLTLRAAIPPQSRLLKPYEGPRERALLAQIKALAAQVRTAERPQLTILTQLLGALGLHPSEPSLPERPAKGSVVIARGRTAAGERFVARAEPPSKSSGCELNVTIESGRGSGGLCFSRRQRAPEPSVNCNEGRLTIQSFTRPATRRVRLLLSDGRTITSRPIVVPARLGGPAGLYYQVVRGPSPIPVSLTELDAHGHVLRVVRLPAIVECTRHPLKYLKGGIRTLATGRIPNGPKFSIVAERYRFLGHVHLNLKVSVEQSPRGGFFISGESSGGGFIGPPGAGERLFKPEESSGCQPQPYDIVFGILERPRDSVLARTPAGLTALEKVKIPADLHAGGVLAYGVFTPPPSALVVRGPAGKTVATERLHTKGAVEQCEGEAEPGAPASGGASGGAGVIAVKG